MKKIITIMTLASALFLTACGDSAPVYDFSSEKSAEETLFAQGKKEGFDESESMKILKMYKRYIFKEYKQEDGVSDYDMIKKYTQGKTFSEMKKLAAAEFKEHEEAMKRNQEAMENEEINY